MTQEPDTAPTPDRSTADEPRFGPYELFVVGLSLFALGALAVESTVRLEPATRSIFASADILVCTLFLIDFAVSLAQAPDRLEYLRRWGWIDLLSSIPALDVLRWGRAVRLVRLLRVLRAVRASKIIAEFVLRRRSESTFLAVALLSILVLTFGSVAILQFEDGTGANIRSAEDAVWWAFVTMTTVGYGDRFPVTTEGRLVAACVMVAGVGLFGTFTGFVASWFVGGSAARQEGELREIRAQLADLRRLLDERRR